MPEVGQDKQLRNRPFLLIWQVGNGWMSIVAWGGAVLGSLELKWSSPPVWFVDFMIFQTRGHSPRNHVRSRGCRPRLPRHVTHDPVGPVVRNASGARGSYELAFETGTSTVSTVLRKKKPTSRHSLSPRPRGSPPQRVASLCGSLFYGSGPTSGSTCQAMLRARRSQRAAAVSQRRTFSVTVSWTCDVKMGWSESTATEMVRR